MLWVSNYREAELLNTQGRSRPNNRSEAVWNKIICNINVQILRLKRKRKRHLTQMAGHFDF